MSHRLAALLVLLLAAITLSTSTPTATAAPNVTYAAHVASEGWLPPVSDGQIAGTTGQARRLEALRMDQSAVSLTWRGHVQNIGWQSWRPASQGIGTTGKALRLEAFQIIAPRVNIEYRAHVQNIGWTAWVSNGATAGTTGRALRIEAVQIRVSPPTSIVFTADTGMEATGQAVLAKIGASKPDFTNLLGDFAYAPAKEAAFCTQVNSRVQGIVSIVSGNHESAAMGDGTMVNYRRCLPAEVPIVGVYGHDYYYEAGPNVRVILISPNVPLGAAERDWVKRAVRSAKAAGRWVVLGMHHPCFSIGLHGCADSTPAVSDLAIALGVDVVIAAHDHNYSRTHQLAGTYAKPVVIDRDNAYAPTSEARPGSVFIVVGNGGHNPRAIRTTTPLYAAAMGTNTAGGFSFGYTRVVATPTTLTVQAVPVTGSFSDAFTVTRR